MVVYDREVSIGRIHGSNREFIEKRIPHIARLLSNDLEQAISGAEIVVVTRGLKQEEISFLSENLSKDQTLVDLVRLDESIQMGHPGDYVGIGW